MRIAYSTVRRRVRSGEQVASFEGSVLDVKGQRVRLVLRGVEKTSSSLVLRISLSADTPAPVVAGNLYTYGEGQPVGSAAGGRFFPITLSLDITSALRPLRGAGRVNVYLNILDPHGRELPDEAITLEAVEIDVRESE
jgi:hypothetical protein